MSLGSECATAVFALLLKIQKDHALKVRDNIINGDKSEMPGLVRASFGLYNTVEEVDKFVDALKAIAAGDYKGEYIQDKASGEYHPKGWSPKFEEYFSLG
jgi:hypothetical protein